MFKIKNTRFVQTLNILLFYYIRVRVGNRNGLLQSLGTWIDQGLVLGAGLFAELVAKRRTAT